MRRTVLQTVSQTLDKWDEKSESAQFEDAELQTPQSM